MRAKNLVSGYETRGGGGKENALLVFATSFIGSIPSWAIYQWGQIRVVVRSGMHGVGLESPRCTPGLHGLHTQPSMTLTKRSGSNLISGSSGLTWEGGAKSNGIVLVHIVP